jgi:Ser/Thr protein kinase RdoA (MazF antagonist)
MATFSFEQVTPDVILDAIESVGIFPESGLTPLNSYENRVYQFRGEDNKRYVIKFYRPERWSEFQLQEEHAFSDLLLENEINVATPLKINGNSLHNWQGYHFCIYPSLGGRMFEMDNLDQLEWLGRILGRMHLVSKQALFEHRPTINIQADMEEAQKILQACDLIPQNIKSTFFHDLSMMVELCSQQIQNCHFPNIKLHGDVHAGNILWQEHNAEPEPLLVDFDDCVNGPAVQDIWMMLSGDRQTQIMQLDTLLSGYEEFNEFDHAQFALIEPLRARRIVCYMAWIAKRWDDIAFQTNFAWFATEKYWEQQVLTIKEQIALLSEPSLRLTP